MEVSASLTGASACQSFLIIFDAQSLWKLKLKIITLIFSTGMHDILL